MASKVLYLMLAFVAAVSAAPNTRLVGGEHTTIEQFPYIVALVYYYPRPAIRVQRCVGSLISSWHVVTSGYCFTGAILDNMEIRAGSTNALSGGTVVRVGQVTKYPGYVEEPKSGDLAVIRLATALGISNTVNVLFLPPQNTFIPDGTSLTTVSWGFEYVGGPQLETLKTITQRKINIERCKAIYSGSTKVDISDRVICANEVGRSTCFGDSGAPMVIGQVLVGTASYHEGCGDDDHPDVFTRIDTYTNWIMQVATAPGRSGSEAKIAPVQF
ncbi:trypsin alpha-3 [Bombyx mori]|uniref:Peptidase S1 domain-containing protein n=1 Tax=Bombyx mori TaxID=7091 RepID=A0A8R1WK22_BOMMO|nr:trypsin alpha-3 [Bombyx mori]